ncbi:MAG: PDZ domain-containing protein, partial [Bacteroidota bacterium]
MNNVFERMTPRSIRIMYTIVTLIVLSVTLIHAFDVMVFRATSNDQCGWLVRKDGKPGLIITDVVPGGVTDRAGVRNGDILLKINGKGFTDSQPAMAIVNAMKPNEYAEYFIERDGKTFTTHVQILKIFDIRYFSLFFLGLGFLVVGFIVVMTRPQGIIQRMFARFGILSMLFFGASQLNLTGEPAWKFYTLGVAFSIGWIFALPYFITFFLHFPVRKKILCRMWLKPVLYAYSSVSVLPLIFNLVKDLPPFVGVILNYTPLSFFVAGL